MRVILIVIFISLLSLPLSAQEVAGVYTSKSSYKDLRVSTLTLYKENRFVKTENIALNHGTIFTKGFYFLLKDTLVLCSEKWEDPNRSTYQVIEDTLQTAGHWCIHEIQVVDKDNKPLPGVVVLFQNRNEEEIFFIMSDKNGRTGSIFLNIGQVDKIAFSFFAKPLTIHLSSIESKSFSLKAILGTEDYKSYDNVPSISRYLVKSSNKSTILQGIGSGIDIVYSKNK